MSGRRAVRFDRVAVLDTAPLDTAPPDTAPPVVPPASGSAQAACAQPAPALPIFSPGATLDEQTPQVVANFAIIGTGQA